MNENPGPENPVDSEASAGSVIQPIRRPRPLPPQPPDNHIRITQEQCRLAYLALLKVPGSRIERHLAELITQLRTTLGAIVAKIENGESFVPSTQERERRVTSEELGAMGYPEDDDDNIHIDIDEDH